MEAMQWFKFRPADWSMGKIQRCSRAARADFIDICCLYWNKQGDLDRDDLEGVYDNLEELVQRKVISYDGQSVVIKFLDEQLAGISELREKRAKAGRKGGKQTQASVKQVLDKKKQDQANSSRGEERRVEKSREEDSRVEKNTSSRASARNDADDQHSSQTTEQHGEDDALPTSRHQTLSGGDKVEAYLLEKQSTKEIIGMKKRWKADDLDQKYAQAVELFAMHLAANDDWKSAGETVKHFNNWMGKGYDKAIEELGQQTSKDPRDQRAPDGMATLEAVLARIEDGDVSLHGFEEFFERRKRECESQGLDFAKERGCTWEQYVAARDALRKELANAN